MAILPGQRLGPYEILAPAGAGGMGEVYRAKDTRLGRTVAIKVLPAHLADDPERRERFEFEARTIASLNHPHICTLYDIGRQDGIDFLVLEYLDGETLAHRLLKGPLPIEQVLQYAVEIADALDKAHRKGITHRDLKPGNIMLTKSGTKLLDFGLAKLRQEAAPATPLSQLPTADKAVTAQGTILGTLQYMAPEQLEAKEVDARTDIFAFGAVVYEMATDKKAFEGKSQASVIGAIMSSEPLPMSSLQPMTPPSLDRAVKKCLAKEPEDRWQSAKDLTDELKWIAGAALEGSKIVVPGAAPAARRKVPLAVTSLIAVAVAALTGLVIWFLKPTPPSDPHPVSRFTITLPPGDRLAALDTQALSLSPDGRRLVYVASRGGAQQLYLRGIDSLEATPIPGTEGASAPFFSPDGQWVGFFAESKLKKVSLGGGPSVTLCSTAGAQIPGGTWGTDGNIVFANGNLSNLAVVSESGGTPKQVTPLDIEKGEIAQRWPASLPGGKAVLFAGVGGATTLQISARVLATGERHDLISGGTHPTYAPTGHLIYAQAGTLMAVPFDSRRLEVTGSSFPVLEGVMQSVPTGMAQFTFSNNGVLSYIPGSNQVGRRMVWLDRRGTEQPLAAPDRVYGYPRLSPDGRRVAIGLDGQIWIYDLTRGTLTRLTFQGSASNPVWTPDGKRVAFQSTSGGPFNLYWQPADGSGPAERLTTGENRQAASSFSPDGQSLAYTETNPAAGMDIWILQMSDRKAHSFLKTPANEGGPQFSPDGRWLAYSSNESGRTEIYVQPYPGPGGKWQISTEGGAEPTWNPNGRELFYRSGAKMMAVDISTQPVFTPGKPKMLFEGRYLTTNAALPFYAVTSDGQRFLMVKTSEQQLAATQINVVLNWFEELKRRAPTEKK